MAYQCTSGVLRLMLVLLGLILVGYVVGRPFFWHLKPSSSAKSSCPSCSCDCSLDDFSFPFSSEFLNSSYLDCGKKKQESENYITLKSEEIDLLKNVSKDHLVRTRALTMDAKRTSSQYQKEGEKCNTGMETCEEARERAQAALREERKLSTLWEERARTYGWKDQRIIYA